MKPDDIYVMPAFVTLAVRDLEASARWYRDVLGFFVLFELPGQLVHLRREKYQDILLKPLSAGEVSGPPGQGVSLCFSVGTPGDVDELASRAAEMGASIGEGPIDRPWNVRELVLNDPDGYHVVLCGGPVAEIDFPEWLSK